MSLTLPPNKDFTAEGWPPELRKALESTLIRALNDFARPVRALLNRGLSASNLNAEVLEKRVAVPADWDDTTEDIASCWGGNCEFAVSIRPPLVGVLPLGATELDASNSPRWDRPVSQPAPAARLVTKDGKNKVRIENQLGLKAGRTYLVKWLALGA